MKIKKILLIDDIQELPDEIIVKWEGHQMIYSALYKKQDSDAQPYPPGNYISHSNQKLGLSKPCC